MGENPPTEAPQVSTSVQVPVNIFTGTLQGILGFTSTQVWFLLDGVYDSQESVLYWKFTYIKECCQLKFKIPASRGGVSYGDRKINFLQALDLWVTDLTLRGKIIDINNFKTDIISDVIEQSRINFEDTRDGKGGLSKPKELSYENWTHWEDRIYKHFASGKKILVCPYLTSSERIRQVPKTVKIGMCKYFIRKVLSGTCLLENQGKFLMFSSH